jgi:twitching motility protein PilU
VHPHKNCVITQREVGVDTDLAAALKNTLRQAPDVILIGEIRDRETMEHAHRSSPRPATCAGTLHANSSNQALDRIINFFPKSARAAADGPVAQPARAVSQRLIRAKDGKGRIAAIEIMLNSPLISDLIFKGEVHEIKEDHGALARAGHADLRPGAVRPVREGLISYEDALRNADSKNDLRLRENKPPWCCATSPPTCPSSTAGLPECCAS